MSEEITTARLPGEHLPYMPPADLAGILHAAAGTLGPVAYYPDGCATCERARTMHDTLVHEGDWVVPPEVLPGARLEVQVAVQDWPADMTLHAAQMLGRLVARVAQAGGGVVVAATSVDDDEWIVSAVFGREAEDSDMAGGAAYGFQPLLRDALAQARAEFGSLGADGP